MERVRAAAVVLLRIAIDLELCSLPEPKSSLAMRTNDGVLARARHQRLRRDHTVPQIVAAIERLARRELAHRDLVRAADLAQRVNDAAKALMKRRPKMMTAEQIRSKKAELHGAIDPLVKEARWITKKDATAKFVDALLRPASKGDDRYPRICAVAGSLTKRRWGAQAVYDVIKNSADHGRARARPGVVADQAAIDGFVHGDEATMACDTVAFSARAVGRVGSDDASSRIFAWLASEFGTDAIDEQAVTTLVNAWRTATVDSARRRTATSR